MTSFATEVCFAVLPTPGCRRRCRAATMPTPTAPPPCMPCVCVENVAMMDIYAAKVESHPTDKLYFGLTAEMVLWRSSCTVHYWAVWLLCTADCGGGGGTVVAGCGGRRPARQPQQPHHRCCHMPTDLTSKSRNHRQPEAFPHIPASWLLLCAEYKLLIFSLQKASLSCGSYSTAATATTSTMLSWILAPENHAFLNNQNTLMLLLLLAWAKPPPPDHSMLSSIWTNG